MMRPFSHPFIDWEWVPSAVACWNQGVDVYVDNTCYAPIAHGRHAYSPLWLRATFLPLGPQWFAPVGLAVAVLFLLSLACLPPPRRRLDFVILLLAATSSLTVFAIERGNVDIIMFLMAILGVQLWAGRLPQRLGAYAVFTGMGLLKFYPLVLLLLALRERARIFIAVSLAAATVVIGFVCGYWDELRAATHNVATGSYFTDLFGAMNLPYGLASLGLRAAARHGVTDSATLVLIGRDMPRALLVILVLEAAIRALWLSKRRGVGRGVAALPARDRGFLLAGAVLICGCFFAGQNIGYRAIFLLLVLPGLLKLAQTLPGVAGRMMLGTCVAILFVMWVLFLQFWLYAINIKEVMPGEGLERTVSGMLHWGLHELAWWWIIGVLLSTIVGFVLDAPIWRTVIGRGCPIARQPPSISNHDTGRAVARRGK
jgi:hypothetical protein